MAGSRPDPHALAAEIVRRVITDHGGDRLPYVIRLSEPPAPAERLRLIAARLTRAPIVIAPHKCKTMDEWVARHGNRVG